MPELTPEEADALRELLPLRNVIRAEFLARPVVLTADGLDDLVSRVTLKIAAYMGRTVAPLAPVVPLRPRKLDPDEPCPGCGALPQRGRNGVARLHGETCDYVSSMAPQLRPSN